MQDNAAGFTGNIPQHYDHGLGPMIFIDYAADIAQRVATPTPARVLETAAGTGIVTRRLRDVLPAGVRLTATDLNAPMLEIAATKFGPQEKVEFQPADAMALPFEDGSFDAVVCHFGLMFSRAEALGASSGANKKPRHSRSAHNEKAPLANGQAGLKVCDERGRRNSRVDDSPFSARPSAPQRAAATVAAVYAAGRG